MSWAVSWDLAGRVLFLALGSIWRQPLGVSWRCLSMDQRVSQLQALPLSSCAVLELLLIATASVSSPELTWFLWVRNKTVHTSTWSRDGCPVPDKLILQFGSGPWLHFTPWLLIFSRISGIDGWMGERMRSVDCPFSWCFFFFKVCSIKRIKSSCLNNKMFYSPELLWTQWGAW